jgi:hypothetical protein
VVPASGGQPTWDALTLGRSKTIADLHALGALEDDEAHRSGHPVGR